MSTPLFEEVSPWYRPGVSEMVLVAFRLSQDLRERMAASPTCQRDGEGQFIREAIAEKLRSMGVEVPDVEVYRGPRKGIGGRPTHRSKLPTVATLAGRVSDLKPVEPGAGEASLAEEPPPAYKVKPAAESLAVKLGKVAVKAVKKGAK
jgi:hypothetical protein